MNKRVARAGSVIAAVSVMLFSVFMLVGFDFGVTLFACF